MSQDNSYEDILNAEPLPLARPPENEYDSLARELSVEREEQSAMSLYSGASIQPEESASVLKLSEWAGVGPDFVSRNRKEMEAQKRKEDSNFDLVKQSSPVVAKWATESPYNSSVAMDDLDNLSKLESSVRDHRESDEMAGFLKNAFIDAIPVIGEFRKFKRDVEESPLAQYGLSQMGLTVARISGGLATAGALGENVALNNEKLAPVIKSVADIVSPGVGAALSIAGAAEDLLNPEGKIIEPPKVLLDNPLTRYLEDKMKSVNIPELSESVVSDLSRGEFSRAGKVLAYQFAANAPTQALIIAATIANPTLGIGSIIGIGAGTAGTATKEAQDAGLDPLTAQLRGVAYGTAEAGFEYVGTFGILSHWSNAIAKSYGKDVARKVVGDMVKTMAHSFAGEANEEAMTEGAQYITDIVTGFRKEPFSFKEMGVRMADAALQGGVMGLGMTGPSAIGAGVARAGMIQESNRAKNFYLSLGDSVESTKLRHRLPEKVYEVVSRITKDGPVENIFIPTEAFETYAQSEKIDPVEFAQSIGALETYKEAREGSGLVKIPLSEWVGKVVGTKAYKRLANDIKFSPTKMTVNESIKFQEQMKKTAEERAPEADSLGKVYDDFKSKVLSVGYTPAEADAHAMLMAERARTRSRILGEDPFSLYQKENIQIRRFDGKEEVQGTEPTLQATSGTSVLRGDQATTQTLPGNQGTTPAIGPAQGISPVAPLASSLESISQHPDFVKMKFDNDSIVSKYAKERGAEITPEFEKGVFQELHDAVGALRKAVHSKDESAKQAVLSKYPDIANEWMTVMFKNWTENSLENFNKMVVGKYGKSRPLAGIEAEKVGGVTDTLQQSQVTDQTETPAFKKWFGDSVVTDTGKPMSEGGNPLVVYHGTDADIEAFDLSLFGSRLDSGFLGAGVYLTTNPSTAGYYADTGTSALSGGQNIMPVFVSLQNPFAWGKKTLGTRGEVMNGFGFPEEIRAATLKRAGFAFDKDAEPDFAVEPSLAQALREELISRGYDGVIADTGSDKEIVVFHPTQIKSATGNAGTFDPTNPSILYQSAHLSDQSFDESFAKTLDEFSLGKREFTFPIPVGNTPDVFISLGAKDIPLVINPNTIIKVRQKHGIGIERLKELPKALRDPLMVFDSVTEPGGLVVLTELVSEGKNIVAAIHLNTNAGRYEVNRIASVHGRGNSQIDSWIKKGLLRYWDEQKATAWLQSAGLYSPIEGDTPSTNRILTKSDIVKNDKRQFQVNQVGDPRAQVRFGNQSINIDLFKKSDMSSLLHEMAHIFAREMGQDLDIIRSKDQTALNFEQIQYIQDAENLLKWVKADSFATMTTEQHEQIARGMEAYFREGKAPSVALQGAFARFREWLLMVYWSVVGLNTDINKEIREVFDRMFAAQEEIGIAKESLGSSPLFSDAKSVGMTDSEAKKYAAALRDAQVAGEEALATKVMAEMKRKEMRPYLDRLAQVKDEVSAEVNQRIEYIALSVLQRGKLPNGDPLPNDMVPIKLSRKAIVDTYGEEHLDLLPKPYVYSRQNGAHPEEAAVIFGFKDGETLLRTLETLEPKDKVIDALVEQKMKAEFGDMKSDGTIAKEAMAAVHNDKRAELLKKEMEYLVSEEFSTFKKVVRRVARPVPSVNHVREQAKAVIGQLTPREIYPSMYSRSESKASREAIELMLKGDINGAFDAKLKERLNHELFRAATEAKDNVDSMVDYFKKFEEPKTREAIGKAGGSYLEQIEGLLERFDFKKSVTLRALDKRKSLVQWVTENSDQISLDDIPPELLNEANRRHYKETPYETLSAMFDTVKTIEHMARFKNKLLANERARTLDAAIDDITASILANHSVNNEPVPIESTLKERFLDKPAEFITSHAKMEFVAEILDGKSKLGPVFRNIIEPLLKAGDKEADIIHDASKKMKEIFGVYTKNERATWYYKKIFIPKINQYLYKPTILSIGMNQGNQYNKEAILEGMRGLGHPEWTQDHIDAILETLDARDIGVINNTLELINSYWGEASGLEKRLKGVAPEKVVGEPYRVKNGTINGGYYPIKFDHKRSWVSLKRAEEQMALGLAGGHWAKAMTQKGHLKERTNTGGQPIRTDLGVINEHIQDVVHDFTHREAILDINRIINDDRFRGLVEKTIGKTFYKEFQPWLNSIATTVRTESISWMEALAAHAKKGVTVVALGLKVSSGLMQTAGYGNTVKELGEKYALIGLRQMGQNGANLKNLWDQISEKSVEMRYRLSTYDRDVRDTMAKMNATGTKRGLLSVPDIYTADMANAFFGFIGMMDLAMSIPSWLGAYQKAMDGKVKGIEKANEKDAVLYADQVVRMTQSANRVMDLARIQRGNQLMKLFTMFYSQMSIQFNQMMKTGMMVGQPGGKADVIRAFIYMVFFQAVVSDFIRGRSKDDDEEWLNRIAKDMAFIPMETMIVLRDIASGLDRFGYSGSPAFDVGNTLTGAAKAVGSRVFGDKEELSKADLKKIVKSAGYVFALPTGQAWKTAEYLHALMQGDEEPDNVVQGLWKSLVTGKTR